MNTLEQAKGRTLTLVQALELLEHHGFDGTDHEAQQALDAAKRTDGKYCATEMLLELGY